MAQDFKSLLILLKDEFGDDLLDMGVSAIRSKLHERGPSNDDAPTVDESETPSDETRAQEGEVLDSAGSDASTIYHDADAFVENAQGRMEQIAVAAVANRADVVGVVRDLILMAGEVRKFEEAQVTVRTGIAASRDKALAIIEAQKAAMMTYLDKTFDERKENFTALFAVVDEALAKNNMQALSMGLESIIKLADSSPFKDLQTVEATAAALTDPDHQWDF